MTSWQSGNGEKALNYLDNNSTKFFELMLNDLWYADSVNIEKLPIAEKHCILISRHLLPEEKLISFNAHSFAVYVLGEIGIGSYVQEGYTLGYLRTEKDKAFASLMFQGHPLDPEFEFSQEKGRWKISLMPFMMDTESRIPARFYKGSTSDKGFISFLLESYSDKPISPDIWKPVKI